MTMKWKCKLSGNVIELPDSEEDNMEGHQQYERVYIDEGQQDPIQVIKRPGRPSKKSTTDIDTDSI
jgi:hypothetical protein